MRPSGAGTYETVSAGELGAASAPSTSLPMAQGITRPRLLNKQYQGKAIDRWGDRAVRWEKAQLYWNDLFHTLLNMPRGRFIAIFFTVYIAEYIAFALMYIAQPDECIPHIKSHFSTALWFSVQTAATIGYGAPLMPNPDCTIINLIVMLQSIFASLVDMMMMGLVFARFSAPSKRASSLRFSSSLVVAPHAPSGHWALAIRVANMRKHHMIRPEINVLLAKPDNPGQSAFECEALRLEDPVSNYANLRLGLAATLVHVIRPGSPLWGLSIDDLLLQEMEVMVFFEALDGQTSNSVQARRSYYAADFRVNERFQTLYMMFRGQRLGLDISEFDTTVALGMPEQNALMRRQKFCDLQAVAQQMLQADAMLQRPQAPPATWHPSPAANSAEAQQAQQAGQHKQRQEQQAEALELQQLQHHQHQLPQQHQQPQPQLQSQHQQQAMCERLGVMHSAPLPMPMGQARRNSLTGRTSPAQRSSYAGGGGSGGGGGSDLPRTAHDL